MPVTRTLNPLPLGDLEPHRFEDLVRQLVHGFRRWKYLDAVGKLGNDGGTDIRGVEALTSYQASIDNGVTLDDETLDSIDSSDQQDSDQRDRLWLISCKRYKSITPSQIENIVAETLKPGGEIPYGYILAAPCDISSESMARARTEAVNFGVQEVHLWTNGHIEDLLFLPQNDALLFAYFNLSLRATRSSRLAEIRRVIAMKRKLLRIFKQDEIGGQLNFDVLIRDLDDVHYPMFAEIPDFKDRNFTPWHVANLCQIAGSSVLLASLSYLGYECWDSGGRIWGIDGTGEGLRESMPGGNHDYWEEIYPWELRKTSTLDDSDIPQKYRISIEEVLRIPYERLIEIDPFGDLIHDGPHLYCRFDSIELGPYEDEVMYRGISLDSSRSWRVKDWLNPDEKRSVEEVLQRIRDLELSSPKE